MRPDQAVPDGYAIPYPDDDAVEELEPELVEELEQPEQAEELEELLDGLAGPEGTATATGGGWYALDPEHPELGDKVQGAGNVPNTYEIVKG